MNRKWSRTILIVVLLPLLHASSAVAQVINFDDLEDYFYLTSKDMQMPYEYAGLRWSNFRVMLPADNWGGLTTTGFYTGMVSPNCIVYNEAGNPATIEADVPFRLVRTYLTAAWQEGLEVTVEGSLGGKTVFSTPVTLSSVRPTALEGLGDLGVIDKVTFTVTREGTPSWPEVGDGSEFVMDNLEIGSGTTIHVTDEAQAMIDIKPGSDINPINAGSKGVIPVAILRTEKLDPADVDPSSLTFGKEGTELRFPKCALEDVDGDGLVDLMCHFGATKDAGFTCGDTIGKLAGKLRDGTTVIGGSDAVQIVPCKKP